MMSGNESFEQAAAESVAGAKHIFAIGSASYREGWGDLRHVVSDVAAIIDAFRHFGYQPAGAYQQGLLDPPTGTYVEERLLEWMEAEHGEGDTLIIYIAGHGVNETVHYLVCSETSLGLARRTVTALRTSRLVELAGVGGAERLLVILDTCYAGDGAAEALALAAKNQLVAAASTAEQRWRWKSLEILAAARCREEADDGAFAAAFTTILWDKVIRAPILAGNRPAYVQLSWIVGEINRAFREAGFRQRADHAQLHGDGVGFLPNPHYVPGLPEELDLAEQHAFAAQHRVQVIGRVEHFGPRARGVHSAGQAGHYFTGRTAILTRLARWLGGQDEQEVRVFQITGSPGIGKSSVLGRMVALADPVMRASIPDSTVVLSTDIPVGAIHIAIHAARRTLSEILNALADALSLTSGEPDDVVETIKARAERFTVVIDALDEAGAAGSERDCKEIMGFLGRLIVRAPQLRLLLGARPHVFNNNPIPGPAAQVDLDHQQWTEHSDIITYAARLLAAPHGPGSDTNIAERLIARAAVDVADIAGRNYLIARMVARALADSGEELWRTDPAQWTQLLPSPANAYANPAEAIGAAFRWALSTQLGPQAAVDARALLSPLAYAKGAGMPLALVWPAAASAFADRPVTEHDLSQLLSNDSAAAYVIEALDADGRSVYRLYHQALADDLRQQSEATSERANGDTLSAISDTQRRLLTAVFGQLYNAVPRSPAGVPDWQHADPYLLNHLPAHAVDASTVDVLLGDVGYLIHADPAAVLPVLGQARTSGARLTAAIYRGCIEHLAGAEPEIRRWALASSAARYGTTHLGRRLRPASPSSELWPRWSASSPQPALLNTFVGHTRFVKAVACTMLNGQPIAVTGSGDNTVRVWDLTSGRQIHPPLTGHSDMICAVACTMLDGEPIAVTVGGDTTVRVWNLTRGEQINMGLTANSDCTWSVACAVLDGRPVAITGGGRQGGCQVWDLTRARMVGIPLETGLTDTNAMAVACTILDDQPVAIGGGEDGTVWIWDLTRRQVLGEPILLPFESVEAVECAVVDDHPVAIVLGVENTDGYGFIRTFDLSSHRQIGRPFRLGCEVESMTCTVLDGRPSAIAAGYKDGMIHVWDMRRRRRNDRPARGPFEGVIGIAATVLDNRPVAVTGSHDNLVQVWDLSSQRRVGRPLIGHDGRRVQRVACTMFDDQPVAVSIGGDQKLRIWDLAKSRQIGDLSIEDPFSRGLTCVASPVSRPLAVTRGDRGIQVWDLMAQEQVGNLTKVDGGWPTAIASTMLHGRPIALVGGRNEVGIWDLTSMTQVGILSATSEESVSYLDCLTVPSGQVIAVGYHRREIKIWDLSARRLTGKSIAYPPDSYYHYHGANGLACTILDGRPVAFTLRAASADSDSNDSRSELLLWDLRKGEQIGSVITIPEHQMLAIECAVISGRSVAFTGGEDRKLRMWDVVGRRLIREWPMPGIVNSISCSAENFVALGAGSDVLILDIIQRTHLFCSSSVPSQGTGDDRDVEAKRSRIDGARLLFLCILGSLSWAGY